MRQMRTNKEYLYEQIKAQRALNGIVFNCPLMEWKDMGPAPIAYHVAEIPEDLEEELKEKAVMTKAVTIFAKLLDMDYPLERSLLHKAMELLAEIAQGKKIDQDAYLQLLEEYKIYEGL